MFIFVQILLLMKGLILYIGLFFMGGFIIPLYCFSVYSLEQKLEGVFVSAIKKYTDNRSLLLNLELTNLYSVTTNQNGETGFVFKNRNVDSFIKLADHSDDSYFTLAEKKEHTILHLIAPFNVLHIDSLWIKKLNKRGIYGESSVFVLNDSADLKSILPNTKTSGYFHYRLPTVFLGLGREIKLNAVFAYSFITVLKQYPALWLLYAGFIAVFFFMFYKVNNKAVANKPVVEYELPVVINCNRAIIAKLDDLTYQIGNYQFKPGIRELLFNREKMVKITFQESELLLMLLESPDSRVSLEQLKNSGITSHGVHYPMVTRLRNCLKDDCRIEIKNIHKWGVQLVIKDENNISS